MCLRRERRACPLGSIQHVLGSQLCRLSRVSHQAKLRAATAPPLLPRFLSGAALWESTDRGRADVTPEDYPLMQSSECRTTAKAIVFDRPTSDAVARGLRHTRKAEQLAASSGNGERGVRVSWRLAEV